MKAEKEVRPTHKLLKSDQEAILKSEFLNELFLVFRLDASGFRILSWFWEQVVKRELCKSLIELFPSFTKRV